MPSSRALICAWSFSASRVSFLLNFDLDFVHALRSGVASVGTLALGTISRLDARTTLIATIESVAHVVLNQPQVDLAGRVLISDIVSAVGAVDVSEATTAVTRDDVGHANTLGVNHQHLSQVLQKLDSLFGIELFHGHHSGHRDLDDVEHHHLQARAVGEGDPQQSRDAVVVPGYGQGHG